jgi:hypothetical protein
MTAALAIREDADWIGAGEALVNSLARLRQEEDRLRLFQQCCAGLGDALYPAFLKLLCAIGRFGDAEARGLVAGVLAKALATARLPSGRMAAWGAASGRSARSFGPIEFLCVWRLDRAGDDPLDEATFETACRLLTALIVSRPEAARAYAEKLRQDVEEPLEGAYSRTARRLLAVFAAGLIESRSADEITRRVLMDLRSIQAEASRAAWIG